jgi:hypothetical protein
VLKNPTWTDNALLCQEVSWHDKQNTAGRGAMVVLRRECTFEYKALADKHLGA